MPNNIIIVDYGMGNLHSVKKKLLRLNVNPIISSNPNEIESADKIILPGVGHFQKAMENLQKLNLIDALNEIVLIKQKPILGICLGMQLMANKSEEGNANGLGWIDAEVVKFIVKDTLKYKIPHTGWNQIIKTKDSLLMKNISDLSEFYFVHSYHFLVNNNEDILNETEYEYKFISAIEKNNIFGVQYHPEKSHDDGERLLKNFIEL
ncbi:MAG: imidazole glycerol phosphate synthase, glutamine amidotransferase subunit [Bacteroidetes bacterium GWF2_33_38]|nr:MAG: imidazole glycerol phosphate synthase, glutamine amidotransferase subunit [Bacteroidetes bacterium GWF2_33_38]OFY75643.1 MAG: imidazole glycerol phosphate synthase, glutamine amidotransferase subunit [Bacteroidetes bacterium RIFOXYA12_FULL_33_9]OFY90643.1 MAG: imidazole glycerol phosphate synthase, glutamine amidotransferase subunit [Bacteroidetes bacterium RIFOXYA2_FULL_33_7]